MYLGRFLRVTLDTYQDTSGSMYLGLFITIHQEIYQDTPRYKITIHVKYMRDTYEMQAKMRTCTFRMYPGRYVSEMQDTCGIHEGYMYMYPQR